MKKISKTSKTGQKLIVFAPKITFCEIFAKILHENSQSI